ncbi:hypothetical protein Cgig2_007243 [Carnegiea gigantea]|uniref:BHLH domain-containing protein n=1 Tax=Carnegiea gigantea TaxID=171969 RepID=A0A9Q1KXL4_9CARY|nr:hypothetical protein Cgig2_007243 [Carnegiea gigantea]
MMNCLDEYNASVSSESFSSCATDDIFRKKGSEFRAHPYFSFDDQRPTKLMKTSSDSWGSSSNPNDSSSPSSTCNLLSFSNPSNASQANYQYPKGLMLKPKLEADYEPVINDIQMDKASVLGEAARYMKHLQERIRTLEEIKLKQQNRRSVVLKKTCLSMDDIEDQDYNEDANSSSSSSNQDRKRSHSFHDEGATLPDIQIKVMNKEVLLIIHCEKQLGLPGTILNEMGKLHFCVTNSNSMPFGDHDLILTLTAQLEFGGNNLSKFMDMSSGEWLSHLAMEDPTTVINHCQMMMMSSEANLNGDGLLNTLVDPTDLFKFDNTQIMTDLSGANERVSRQNTLNLGAKEIKSELQDIQHPNSCNWRSSIASPSSGQFISFGNSNCDVEDGTIDLTQSTGHSKKKKRVGGAISMSSCPQEHVLAERKRREKMTQRFLALSALIPGLTKMDKASILGDAAKYLKELEEHVKLLEDQTTKRTVESAILVKAVKDPSLDDGNTSLEENNTLSNSMNQLLEIEARASNKNVLIRIHSQKNQGLVQKVLNEIETLNLTTLNCQTMPFGGYALNITIIAQMNGDLCMTMKDLVLHLRRALQQFLCHPN